MLGRMMVSALALTGVAYAQESTTTPAETSPATSSPQSTADRTVYDAAFFAQFNPQTAADMVSQVPGFSLDGGDGRRGFSGAVGNLLIDGIRPTSKSQSLNGILSRIPANQVVRIEVLRGAAVAGDASGQSQLVNVVRTPTAGSGVWSTGFELTSRDVPAPRGEVSYSGRNGQVEWGLGGSVFSQYRSLPGWRYLFNPADTQTQDVDTPSPRDFREVALNGNLAFPLWGGRVSATGQVDWYRFHHDSDYLFTNHTTHAPIRTLNVEFTEQEPNFEVGVNYDRDLGPWSMSLVGLVRRGYYESQEDDLDTDHTVPETHTISQELQNDTGETILRGSLARQILPQHRVEFGGEAAYNTLDQSLVFAIDGSPLSIPDSNVLVEEERAEFFAVDTWRPNDQWSVESRIAWETSTLTFTGDSNDETALEFWKPSIQITRNFAGNNQLRLRLYRDVGQLNFGDFVSNAAIADSLIDGGNTGLTPQTDWRAELGADLHYKQVALSLTLTHHQIEDVNDLVPITSDNGTPLDTSDDFTYDAPGNIGEAEATSLDVNFSTPLSWLLPGAKITVAGYLWDTSVNDPVTNQDRIISFQPESQINVEFRQDIQDWKFAWGINVFKQAEVQAYRLNEIDTSEEGPWTDLWVETTALPNNMKLRLWAANIGDGNINRDRRFFNSPDRTGPNTSRDLRERFFERAPWFIVELSGTF